MLVVAVTSSHLPAECAYQSACHDAVSPRVEEGAARPPGRNVTASATSSVLRRLHDNSPCSDLCRGDMNDCCRSTQSHNRQHVRSCRPLGLAYTTCNSQPRLCRRPSILQEKTNKELYLRVARVWIGCARAVIRLSLSETSHERKPNNAYLKQAWTELSISSYGSYEHG
jgi:hypothetical protein